MRRRPGRSVTSMRLSGRKASPQGFWRLRATVSTITSTLSVRKRWVSWARADGMAPRARAQARAIRGLSMGESLRRSDAGELDACDRPSTVPPFTRALSQGIDVDSLRVLSREGLGRGHDGEGCKAQQHDQGQRAAAFLARVEAVDAGRNVTGVSWSESFHWSIPSSREEAAGEKLVRFKKVPASSESAASGFLPKYRR